MTPRLPRDISGHQLARALSNHPNVHVTHQHLALGGYRVNGTPIVEGIGAFAAANIHQVFHGP